MRTTIDLPDPLLRQLKSQAALEGMTFKALVQRLVEKALEAGASTATPAKRSTLPSISIGVELRVGKPSNAGLMKLADEA